MSTSSASTPSATSTCISAAPGYVIEPDLFEPDVLVPDDDVLVADEVMSAEVMSAEVMSAEVMSDEVVERAILRLEFEAIIAAGYRAAADEPRPAPPPRRVATIVGGARPDTPPAGGGRTRRLGRPWPGPTAGLIPRERGPPAAGTVCCAPSCSRLRQRPRRRIPRPRTAHRVDRGPGQAAAGVRRHHISHLGRAHLPHARHRAPHGAPTSATDTRQA